MLCVCVCVCVYSACGISTALASIRSTNLDSRRSCWQRTRIFVFCMSRIAATARLDCAYRIQDGSQRRLGVTKAGIVHRGTRLTTTVTPQSYRSVLQLLLQAKADVTARDHVGPTVQKSREIVRGFWCSLVDGKFYFSYLRVIGNAPILISCS